MYNAHPRFWPKLSGRNVLFKYFHLTFTSLYLETKLIIVFQGIIFHTDIVIAF